MINPTRLKIDENKEYVMIQGYVRSVSEKKEKNYNSVSFLVNSTIRGPKAPLISVMCFGNDEGPNFKKLTEYVKGRFVTFFAEKRLHDNRVSYKAIAISIAPKEFKEKTHPINDDEVMPSYYDNEEKNKLLAFDFNEEDLPFSPSKLGLTNSQNYATVSGEGELYGK